MIRAESEYYSVTPLLEHLAGDKALSFAIIQDDLLRHPSAKRTLDRAGVAYIPIHSETTLGDLLKIAGKIIFDRRQTCKVWQDAASTMLAPMKIDEPAEYDDIAQICAAPEILVPTLQSSTFWALEVLVFARQFADLIGRSKAKAVLCLDMIDKWGEVVGHLGRRLGCTTFTLQNAAMSNLVLPKAISTDFFYAVGSAVREHLVTCGADPDRVLVSGSPAYEKLRTTLKAAKNCDNRKNRTSIPTIAITPQPFADRPDLNEKLIRAVCKAVPPNTRAKVIIKLHPRETPAPYERIRSKINEPTIDIEIWHGESLPTLFGCSDLLVSRTSTTLMTAQFAAMPSVAFLSDMEVSSWNSIDYMNSPSILKAFSENELRELLHGLLFSESCEDERAILEEKMRQFVADNMGTFREGPTQGIANHIKRTISTAKSADV
ncbi:MAG: hypothetical protein D6763_01255 [Alphaproteobacteria bacterium]|nr:MAG: hypothetical protein D6763_01255 [Alphaproteobacteria bacterium]